MTTKTKTAGTFSIAELARAVAKSETFVRQHVHRKHLTARKDGRNVVVAMDEAVRWARERGLSIDLPIPTSFATGETRGRTARMTVLVWHGPNGQPRNIFTLIRHRRRDALGPWASEPDGTWSSDDLGHGLWLYSLDGSLGNCHAAVEQILDLGILEIDGIDIQYSLEPHPRRHRAYRDDRPFAESSVRSPFAKHSAEIIEYWSFAAQPRKRWLEVLDSPPANIRSRLARLGFPLDLHTDRIGNLMIAGAEDTVTCDLVPLRDGMLRLHVNSDGLLPGAYRATVWATHSGDEVFCRELSVVGKQTDLEIASDIDHIGFAIYRTIDGECIDLMEEFLFKEVEGTLMVESGPTLQLRNRQGRMVHEVTPSSAPVPISVEFNEDNTELDKGIRRWWLDHQVYQREVAARREGNFARFQPGEFDQAVRYFIGLVGQDRRDTAPIYLADPFFMDRVSGEEGDRLYLDLFAATADSRLLVLCGKDDGGGSTTPWWSGYPDQITSHVSVRSFRLKGADRPAFHDRYLITPKREFIITHSLSGWRTGGVTFAALPYDFYRAEADRLWSMDTGSTATDLLVRKIW